MGMWHADAQTPNSLLAGWLVGVNEQPSHTTVLLILLRLVVAHIIKK